jgi:hypothetical protein
MFYRASVQKISYLSVFIRVTSVLSVAKSSSFTRMYADRCARIYTDSRIGKDCVLRRDKATTQDTSDRLSAGSSVLCYDAFGRFD